MGGYAALCLYLDTQSGSRWLANEVATRLAEQIGARVEIGEARIGLPGHIALKGVKLYDRADSLMITAETLNGSVSVRQLLSTGKVRLRSIALLDGEAHIYQLREDTATNIQFLFDAFKSEEEPSRPTDISISQLVVRRFKFSFDQRDKSAPLPGRFSSHHIAVSDLSASLSLPSITDTLQHVKVRELSFRERSGFTINQLQGELWRNDQGIRLRNFVLRLPRSYISQRELALLFDSRNFLGTLHTSGVIKDAKISTDDMSMLLPELSRIRSTLSLTTAFDISPRHIALSGTNLFIDNPQLAFQGDLQADFSGQKLIAVMLNSQHLTTNAKHLNAFMGNLGIGTLPDIVQQLGSIDFQGNLAWRSGDKASFDGELSTSQGAVSGHAVYTPQRVEGNLFLKQIDLAQLLGNSDLPGPMSAQVDGTVSLQGGTPQAFDGNLHLQQMVYRGRLVTDISTIGHISTTDLALKIDSRDAAATLYGQLTATISGSDLQQLKWQGVVKRFEPAAWGIDVPNGTVFSLDGTVEANDLAHLASLDGKATLAQLTIVSGGQTFSQEDITLALHPIREGHDVNLQTPYGELSMQGSLDPKRIQAAVESILMRAVPRFVPLFWPEAKMHEEIGDAAWHVVANISDDALFSKVLHIPVAAPAGLTLEGTLAEGSHRTEITLRADTLSIAQQEFNRVNAFLQGEGREYSILLQTEKQLAGMDMELAASVQTTGGELNTLISWRDKQDVFHGEMAAYTFPPREGKTTLRTDLKPTEVFFKDSVWTLFGGTVYWGRDTLAVNKLYAEHESQHIVVDGAFSQGSPDSITADLRGINLEYVFDLLKFHPVYFAGIADGHAVLTFQSGKPIIKSNLLIDDFSINGGPLGLADIKGEVDLQALTIDLDADLLEAPLGRTLVKGQVLPQQEMLDLNIDARNTNLQFLRKYIGGFLHNFSGRAKGYARLAGTFKELQLTGNVLANVDGGIPVLGCSYQVDSANVVMTPGLIDIRSGNVHDNQNGFARAVGKVQHQFLGDFEYNFDFDLDHCLIYDRSRTSDLTFSSHALASGQVSVRGEPGRLDCDINVRPERGSNFHYHLDLPDDYTSSNLLTIRPAPSSVGSESQTLANFEKQPTASSSDVYMNLNLDMQPDVPLTVIMDEKTGDNIVVRGHGPLRATYFNKGQFNLFGTYTVDGGVYKMTIQDIIHKDFHFKEGGTVVFSGKPFDGVMDMQAAYTVPSASLSDLNLTGGVSQNGIRVNCLLNFSGQLQDPKVRFDLEMPTVSQDVQQMVRSLISTDEEMNRQVLYLLAIGRFYTYDYASTEQTQSQGETAMNSFLSNTLSGQLNNFISSAMGQSNWTFGTNLSTGNYGWEDVGVEGQIGGRLLNNRLLINGNFGYRNSATQQGGTVVGDFDVQYLLTSGGGMRLKAYNETNDRYFTKNSLTTQGVGFVVQRSFNRFFDLFRRKKKETPSISSQ